MRALKFEDRAPFFGIILSFVNEMNRLSIFPTPRWVTQSLVSNVRGGFGGCFAVLVSRNYTYRRKTFIYIVFSAALPFTARSFKGTYLVL
jgi:hypothetical protein